MQQELPKVKEPRVTKLDAFDPAKIAAAYNLFLNHDATFESAALELGIPIRVLLQHARKGAWLKKKEEMTRTLELDAEQRYREFLAQNRLPTAKSHLDLSSLLEEGIRRIAEEAIKDGKVPDDKMIRRLTEALASVTGVSARAAGITDRPAPVASATETQGKQPLIVIGVNPSVAAPAGTETINITDYVTEEETHEDSNR